MRARGPRGRTSPPTRRADRLWARTPRQRARGRHRPTPFRVTSEPRHVRRQLLPQTGDKGLVRRAGAVPRKARRLPKPTGAGNFPRKAYFELLRRSRGLPRGQLCPLPHAALSRVPEVCRVGGDQGVIMEPDLAHHEAPCPRAPCSRRACPAGSWHASLQGGLYHVPRCWPWPQAEVPHQHENSAPRRLGVPA